MVEKNSDPIDNKYYGLFDICIDLPKAIDALDP